jgi:hypothetical protein
MNGIVGDITKLYSLFVLRDFAGKIVPGAFLLFSITSLFVRPSESLDWLSRQRTAVLAVVAGLAWSTTLAVQTVGNLPCELAGRYDKLRPLHDVCLWGYFPFTAHWPAPEAVSEYSPLTRNSVSHARHAFCSSLRHVTWSPDHSTCHGDLSFPAATMRIVNFMDHASEGERNQYERFVIIKEACGNLFLALSMSILAWAIACMIARTYSRSGRPYWWDSLERVHAWHVVPTVCVGIAVLVGLHHVHWQHVRRQWSYAHGIASLREAQAIRAGHEARKERGQAHVKRLRHALDRLLFDAATLSNGSKP